MVWSEQLGFDEVWLTEHHFIDYGLSVDPTTLASAVALLDRWGVSRQIYVAPTDAQALAEARDAEMWYQESFRKGVRSCNTTFFRRLTTQRPLKCRNARPDPRSVGRPHTTL